MPPAKEKDLYSKPAYGRSYSNISDGMSMSARVYHPATNLMPPSPPNSPTGMAPSFSSNAKSTSSSGASWSRQNSTSSGKYS